LSVKEEIFLNLKEKITDKVAEVYDLVKKEDLEVKVKVFGKEKGPSVKATRPTRQTIKWHSKG
jgi:hypothetical protein